MSCEWPLQTLDSLTTEVTVGYVGTMSNEYVDKGIPFLRSLNVNPFLINPNDLKFISSEFHSKLKKSTLRPGDVVIVRTGKPGTCAVIPEWLEEANCSDLVIVRCGPNLRPHFLSYWVNSVATHHVSAHLVGAVQQHFNVGAAKTMLVASPSLNVQDQVLSILRALDDRIALLRETNATLEAIAQALFKSWFVDFDPVHARARGEQPAGLAHEVAALFPDSFEESELGMVPKGWRVLSFTETIDVIGGGTPKTSISEYWNGDIPWFSVVDAPATTDVFVIETEKHITCEGLNKSSTKLLPVGTTIISARGTVGRLALVGQAMAMNQSCYGLSGKAGDVYFTYFSTHRLVETLKQRTHGSVFDTITRDTLAGVSVVYPQTIVITAFEETIAPVMERIKENLIQARTLATLRDTLLPRLISGQLRLPEAEAMVEGAS
ncbi:restriction endonuclease subunit S [Aeromonas veronii]|uniref:restriction endonuclease subunit S n=1 Tax=Aeromonas TaxID=642 RepID=UPI00191CE6E4|nr:restriction endonuclease subunit S [Aeromonas veronii]MBL0622544.1 restriction endonuclease subunit S [Aeromonas veronii]